MTEKQEIRAKSIELHIAALALIPEEQRLKQLIKWQGGDVDLKQAIINGSKIFEDFIADQS
jgi:hypothetical protein